MRRKPAPVRLRVENSPARPLVLVLEAWGETYDIAPGEHRNVVYRGDRAPTLTLDVGEGEFKVWAEGPGLLDLVD